MFFLAYINMFIKLFFPSGCQVEMKKMTSVQVYEAVLSWVKHHEEERSHHLDILLRFVDFKKMSSDYVETNVFGEKLISECTESISRAITLAASQRLLEK